MIVLDVTSFFSAGAGGIRTYCREKARHLPARGIEYHAAVPGPRASTEAFGGGWLHRIPGPALPGNPEYRCFGDLPALWRAIAEIAPDVIELGSHYLLPQLLLPALRQRRGRARPPALFGFYHADFPETYVAPALSGVPDGARRAGVAAAWGLVRRQHRRYAATLAGSHRIAARLVGHGVPRVHWIGLGVDIDRFRPRPRPRPLPGEPDRRGRPLLACVGRLARDKGLEVALAAIDPIHDRTGARLVIAGAGPLEAAVRAFAEGRPYVELRGLIDPEEVAALVAGADALIAAGPHESFSFAAAEALAAATPVLGADQGGNAELIERSGGGLCFAAGDPAALADAATALLAMPAAEREAIGARGRAHVVEELTWERVFDRLLAVYRRPSC